MNKTDKEREDEDFLQMLELSKWDNLKKQKGKKHEKIDNSGEAECFKRISENIDRMYKE